MTARAIPSAVTVLPTSDPRIRAEVEALNTRVPAGTWAGSTFCKVAGRQTPPLTRVA